MTLVDVSNQILTHFADNTIFSFENHAKNIKVDENVNEFKDQILRTVLSDMEKNGVVKKVSSTDKEVWILVRGFDTFTQNVQISPYCAMALANTVNKFVETHELDWGVVDVSSVTEEDIRSLIEAFHIVIEADANIPNPENPDEDSDV